MGVNSYRDKIKRRLGIREEDGQWDQDIDDYTLEAIKNLYPISQREMPPEIIQLDMNVFEFDLSSDLFTGAIDNVRKLEMQDTNGNWRGSTEFTQHATVVYIEDISDDSGATTWRVQGNGRYTNGNVPEELDQVIINWAMSEFYSGLTGDKRKYDIYSQTTGARSVDNIRDLSDYYLDRGNQILADRATIRGV